MPGPMEGVVASVLLQLPFVRHLFAWIGAHPAGEQPRAFGNSNLEVHPGSPDICP